MPQPIGRTFDPGRHPGRPDVAAAARLTRTRRTGTRPELELRRALHALGLRFRVGVRVPGLPRRSIDVAFRRWRVAVFVDGCFWHGCADHGHLPKNNAAWWWRKVLLNQARDADTDAWLADRGWTVVRVWEHEVPARAAERVVRALARRGHPRAAARELDGTSGA